AEIILDIQTDSASVNHTQEIIPLDVAEILIMLGPSIAVSTDIEVCVFSQPIDDFYPLSLIPEPRMLSQPDAGDIDICFQPQLLVEPKIARRRVVMHWHNVFVFEVSSVMIGYINIVTFQSRAKKIMGIAEAEAHHGFFNH
ncbi:unnamed protein product, partial [marine sediment metagenome]